MICENLKISCATLIRSVVVLFSLIIGFAVQAKELLGVDLDRGEYIARLGNCVACHTVENGQPFTGGLKMEVPNMGAIYATNITPDPETGIGLYSFEDFDQAMRKGIAKEGHRLYPAMPYPAYAKMSEQDMRDLYDYFMHGVKPVHQENLPAEISPLLSARWPLGVWSALFTKNTPYQPDPERSAEWNRGAYLTQGLGHCGACHTPRGLFFQEKAMDERNANFLAGATLDHWYASSLNGDINSGLGRWTKQDIVDFLKTGHNRFGSAFGTMVEVVNTSTHHMTGEDLNAMAEYLKSLPAVKEKGEPAYSYNNKTASALKALEYDEPGALIYSQYCSSCHQSDGKGQSPYHPPLAGNPVIMDADPSSLINITLNGSLRVIANDIPDRYNMPYFREQLTDTQIAQVISFMRSGWGNTGDAVTVKQVSAIREATDPTRNDIRVLRMK